MCANENEKKKAYLRRYLDYKQKEKEILLEIEELESSYILPSKVVDDMPHGSGGGRDLSVFASQYDRLRRRLIQTLRKSTASRTRIVKAIESMPCGEAEKTLLRYRYILGYKWENIAEAMGYEERWTLELHGRALQKFEIPKRVH